jgi:predicted HAD superfamily Cof-like phosphohydrolase
MSKDLISDQIAIMRAFGNTTTMRDLDQASLYLKLHLEELCETMCAANPGKLEQIEALFGELTRYAVVTPDADLVEMFDGAIDCAVVNLGFGLSLGLPMQAGWAEVHRSNVAKVDPTTGLVTRRDDGKVLKPEGWTPPDLKKVLEARYEKA